MKLQQLNENELFKHLKGNGKGHGERLKVVHYSHKDNLNNVDPSRHGTGYQGMEQRRASAYPEYFVKNRSYWYVADKNGKKESGLGSYGYKTSVRNVYDFHADKANFWDAAIELAKDSYPSWKKRTQPVTDNALLTTIVERMIKEAGYDGYFAEQGGRGGTMIAVMFNNVRLKGVDAVKDVDGSVLL